MYATKRLRGLLALWLVLILVFGLGTTVYAAGPYEIITSTDDSDWGQLKLSPAPSDSKLYPGDTIIWKSDSGCFVVYYEDRAAYANSGANVIVSDGATGLGKIGYHSGNTYPHEVLGFLSSDSVAYSYSVEKPSSFASGTGSNHPVYKVTLQENSAIPPSPAPDPAPDPAPSPEPAPAPIRCDLPVLFDPIGPMEKYGGAGGSITMSVSARDALRYQWQVNYNDGKGWRDVEGAVTDTYTLENLDAIHEGWQFRAVVRNNCGPVISPNFTIHVHVPVAEVPETGGPGAALAALGLVSLGAGLGIARKRRG